MTKAHSRLGRGFEALTEAGSSTALPTMQRVIEVDPKLTRMNRLHRRSEKSMSDAAVSELAQSIKASGQVMPARGWRLREPAEDGALYELTSGGRRRAACILAGTALRLELVPQPDDQTLHWQMFAENFAREDYHPLELARETEAALTAGVYRDVQHMAEVVGADPSKFYRALQLLKLPPEVLALYTDPSWLPLVKGAKLSSACENPAVRKAVVAAAQSLEREGVTRDPTSDLLKAAESKPSAPPKDAVKFWAGKVNVGAVRGTAKTGLTLQLTKQADPGLRAEIAELLKRYFPSADLSFLHDAND